MNQLDEMTIDKSNHQPSYFVSWNEFGTRYRLMLTPIAAFGLTVWRDLGVAPEAVLVTLIWPGSQSPSAFFNAGTAGVLVDDYIGSKLGVSGEDLQAIAPKLRAVLVRS